MPDYKKMDCKLFHAAEQAANLLIAAQRECEELYVRPSDRQPVRHDAADGLH